MDAPIFSEKFRTPVPRGLVRERLETRTLLLQPAEAGPASIGLVLGPPGSGKTTLLSHAAASSSPSAWYRVGPEDGDESTFTQHLCHALAAATDDDGIVAAGAEGRIAALIAALDVRRGGPVQLVIDDVHEVVGTAAERALGTFLSLRSRDVTVILGSRRPLLLNTSRLMVSGELIELTGDDLRFRSWEVEQLFRDVYSAPLSPEGAAALTRRTGGWAAGLHLFHLATLQLTRADRERAIDDLSTRSRLVRAYLASTVIGSLNPERARFLVLTSTLGVLSGELCDELLGIGDSAQILAELESAQFFTTSTDGGATYRYHHVLQVQLESQLVADLGSRSASELYHRSGELLERSGLIAAAVHAYARAEDWVAVCRLLEPDAAPVMDDAEFLGLLSSPRAPKMDAGLILTEARLLSRRGRVAEAVESYRRVEALIDDPHLIRACAAERREVSLWLASAPESSLNHAHGTGPLEQLRMVTGSHEDRAADPLSRGIQLVMAGDFDGAEAQLARDDLATGWPSLARRLTGCFIDLIRGGCETSAARVESIVLEADVGGWPWLARVARMVQAATLLASDSSTWHVASAMEFLDSLARQDDAWTECVASLVFGAGFAQAGHDDLATRALARAADLAEELDAPALREWADRMAGDTAGPMPGAGTAGRRGAPDNPLPVPVPVVLRCLGGFSLTVGGIEVGWRDLRPRARSLLMLLAGRHGQAVHREELVDALWPDLSISSGIRSLQVAVSSIRHCLFLAGLSKESLRRQGDAYVLAIGNVDDQLRSFERLVGQSGREAGREALRLRSAALELYVGDLLPEAGPAEWVVTERDRLCGLAASVASAAATLALELGDAAEALRLAQRSTEIDAYHDLSWKLVMDSSARLGDLAGVATARRELARVRAELGVPLPADVPPARASGHRHRTTNVRGGHRRQKGVDPAQVDLDTRGWTEDNGDAGFRIAR